VSLAWLRIEPLPVHLPQQPVFRVQGAALRPVVALLLVRGREHDRAVHFLDRPAAADEDRRQVIEQFGMRRRVAAEAEIARRADQTRAEMMQPDAVDHHPGRQRIDGSTIAWPVPAGRCRSERNGDYRRPAP